MVQCQSLHCPRCDRQTLYVRYTMGDGWGCLLMVLTCGLWWPVWMLLALVETCYWYRCQTCGRRSWG